MKAYGILALFSYGYTGVFTSSNCDYGTTAAKNDNSPNDIYQAGSTYNYGDDASFTCASASCL